MRIKELRSKTKLSQSKFAAIFGIPVRTLQQWEIEAQRPSDYVVSMMEKILKYEGYI